MEQAAIRRPTAARMAISGASESSKQPSVFAAVMFRNMLCCCLSMVPLASCLATESEVSLAGDFSEPRVLVAAPHDSSIRHLSWPKVVRTPDGTLVAAFIAGSFHGSHGGGCPAVSVSTDEGQTFTAPHILKRYRDGDEYTSAGNVALGVADDGAVVLLSMAYNANVASTIDGWRSEDSGRTWQTVDVSALARGKTGSVFGHVVNVPSKGLAVFGHYRPPATDKTGGIWMAWSTDNGQSWSESQSISDLDEPLVEPAFTFADGRFVGLVRGARNSGRYVQMTSDDFGQTWQTKINGLVSDYPGTCELPSPHIAVDPNRPDHLYALVSERYKSEPRELIGRIVLYEANSQQLNWTPVGEVARFPKDLGRRKDITYAWMTPVENGRWLAVFYCGEARGSSDIYGLNFDPTSKY
ncbi:glycoside hydrolase [Aeoliella sp. ICT_H6.2]|uniref:Glycoside hydrolase n=1 Tax=Aeoliella straminimaris TaxID=2954799 RepID=A0A9X2JL45_9BACT|nr:sialidase family protein [Aeoliella straminimaris]MCO6048074.1 glycoside hydrolase [Aeoliella straminimaris]